MSSSKRASLSSNSPLDQLFRPAQEREAAARDEAVEEGAPPEQPAVETAPPAVEETPAPASQGAARPSAAAPQPAPSAAIDNVEEERELRQTTIMIYADQSDWLDDTCYLARRESGANISKAAILRELVEMAREGGVVAQQLRQRLGLDGEGGR